MRYFDFTIQSIILLVGSIFLLADYPDWFVIILSTQLFLGAWQITSSFISVVSGAPLRQQKTIHLLISSCYLIFLYACVNSGISSLQFSSVNFQWLLTIPAWSLGVYYYTLTIRWAWARKRKRGSFLPNIRF